MTAMKAENDLGVIRSLVERREIYRTFFARVAVTIGALSILASSVSYVNDEVRQFFGRPVGPREFAFAWIAIFGFSGVVAGLFLARAVRGNGDALFPARTKMVLNTIAPCLLIAAAFTTWFFGTGYLGAAELDLVIVWIATYGLMLLSTSFFAPRSIALLGWAFLLTGVSTPVLADKIDNLTGNVPVTLMGVTFGLYHIIYAALNWRAVQMKS